MLTYMPYADFNQSARALDDAELQESIEAARCIYHYLRTRKGCVYAPLTRMWKGHLPSLVIYHNSMVDEARRRNPDFSAHKLRPPEFYVQPWWVGWRDFHLTHQANLLRMRYHHYKQFGWKVPKMLGYIYPLPERGHFVSTCNSHLRNVTHQSKGGDAGNRKNVG